MRSILLFLSKNYFVFLFLFLELFCFWLVVQNNTYQRASIVNSSNYLAAKSYQINHEVFGYFGLKKVNADLAVENAKLRSQSLFGFAKYRSGDFVFEDTIYNQNFVFSSATVVNNSINRRNNYLTLNKGYKHGIKAEMGVFSSNGVIGIVKDVSENYCTVLSVLHKNSSISAKIKNTGYFGSLIWDGADFKYGNLVDIPSHVKIQYGSQITTSGYSSIFPEGIPIGSIKTATLLPGESFLTVGIEFYEDMSNIQQVYIVKNLLKREKNALETKTENGL